MATLDRIRLTGLLPKEPRKGLFPLRVDQRISNPRKPSPGSDVTSTSSTSAPRGPALHQPTTASTASGEPSRTASTAPSVRFRTHPGRTGHARPLPDVRAMSLRTYRWGNG